MSYFVKIQFQILHTYLACISSEISRLKRNVENKKHQIKSFIFITIIMNLCLKFIYLLIYLFIKNNILMFVLILISIIFYFNWLITYFDWYFTLLFNQLKALLKICDLIVGNYLGGYFYFGNSILHKININ